MDNARIHYAREVRQYITDTKMPVLYSGVASCKSAPVKRLFCLLKRGFGDRCLKMVETMKTMGSRGYYRPLREIEVMGAIVQ